MGELQERAAYFGALEAEYGYATMGASAVEEAFAAVTRLHEMGFQRKAPRKYARAAGGGITSLVELQALKGASYWLRWGVSLPFIPRKLAPALMSYGTPHFDLFETPYDFLVDANSHWKKVESYIVYSSYGPRLLAQRLESVWSGIGPAILAWLDDASTPEGALRRAEEQAARK